MRQGLSWAYTHATVRTTGLPQDAAPASCFLDTPQLSPVLWLFFFSSIGRREDLWKERERKEGSRQKIQTNHEPRLVQPLYSLQQLLYSEPFRLPSDQAFLSAYTGNIPPDFYSQNMVFYPIYTYFLYIYV